MTASALTADQLAASIVRAIQCETAQRAAGIKDPAELVPLARYAEAAEQHQDALAQYFLCTSAHAGFAARHDQDDPGHEDHQRRVGTARVTLAAAERLLALRRAELQAARGLGTFAGETAGQGAR